MEALPPRSALRPAVDYTPLMEQVRRSVDRGSRLLEQHRLVACMGSRIALTLFINAMRPGHQLVGAVTTQAEGLELLRRTEADLLLCTDRLEQGNGGALVAAAKQLQPSPRTLMVVTQPRRLITIRTALDAGCDGLCLESELGFGKVLQAFITVSEGAVYIERGLNDQYHQGYAGLEDAPLAPLTGRELEVLQRVAAGTPNGEIASQLFIGLETVKSHMNQIRQKLQARDRAHAAVKGIRLGLIEWPDCR